jgi:uncharacterized Zn finger protein
MPTSRPYGVPLHCPKCTAKNYYAVLKLQGGPKMLRCPNCDTLLVRKPKDHHPTVTDKTPLPPS